MTASDEYLAQVRRAMIGMDSSVREDILRELRSHLAESMAANGGNASASLAALGPATQVGRHYRELYGYGRPYRLLFAVVAFLIAVPSVPVLIVGTESLFPFTLSIVFLLFAAMWILWVSVAAGARAGLVAGVGALVARFVAFGVATAVQPGAVTSAGGLSLLIVASAMLVALGWVPGTARKAWSGPRPEL